MPIAFSHEHLLGLLVVLREVCLLVVLREVSVGLVLLLLHGRLACSVPLPGSLWAC